MSISVEISAHMKRQHSGKGAQVWRLAFFCLLLLLIAYPVIAADAPPEPVHEESPEESTEEPAEESEQTAPAQDMAWEAMWSGQRDMINEMRETALKLSDSFSEQTANLSVRLQPFEEEARRLLVFVNTFQGHPNAMESVNRRMSATIEDLNQVLKPVIEARSEAQGLLERVNYMAASLPDDTDKSRLSESMRAYMDDITKTRLRLTAVLAQYNSIVPSLEMVSKLEKARAEISRQLPALWRDHYLQRPIAWLQPESWINLKRDIHYSWQAMILRLPVEMPGTAPQWGTALLRFFIGLFFAGLLSLVLKKRLLEPGSPRALRHIFRVTMPWLISGFAIFGASMSANGEFFRMFVAAGSACLLIGQVYLAWDLRRLQYPDMQRPRAPFLKLLPLAFTAYGLLYLPLTSVIVLLVWAVIVACSLLYLRTAKKLDLGQAKFESEVLECEPIILWISLFLAISGLQLYSMLLYLTYVSLAIALELSFAGMAIVGNINEHLPQEGVRAVLTRLLIALAAPFVLVLAVIGVCLWIAMLPGGTYLLGEYALKGVSVGATQFNIIQILAIVSAFYLTRTIVSMGTRLLSRLPQQSSHFDPTLITPMQTFLTYATWAAFGLFVLHALGMQLSNLAMVAGGLSVGIGFGMQTIVNNFLSGLILIFGRTLRVGDVVEVGGLTGRVRKISVRATMVETYDNAIIFVPNSEFMSGRLINWTSFSRSVRRQVGVGVAYGTDTAKVIKLLIDIAKAHENVLKYPVPSVNFADFGSSTLDFQLRFWVKDYEMGASTMSDIRLAINRVFNENNIEIAFPQLDVHIKDTPKPRRPVIPRPMPKRPLPARAAKPASPPGQATH